MRRLGTLMALLFAWTSMAGTIEGTWSGKLKVGEVSLRIVFDVERQGDGWVARMSSPDQGATDIPVDRVAFDGKAVTFVVDVVRGEYSGMVRDDEIEGEWRQVNVKLPLLLKRGAAEALRRPQEPLEPLPYEVREECWAAAASVRLCGTLTLPRGKTVGALVLLAGSGPLDRDALAFGHRPLLVLADRPARSGFATLRFDHRGCKRLRAGGGASLSWSGQRRCRRPGRDQSHSADIEQWDAERVRIDRRDRRGCCHGDDALVDEASRRLTSAGPSVDA